MARLEPLSIHAVDDEIRHLCEEAERVLQEDPGFAKHPTLKAAVARRLEQTSIS